MDIILVALFTIIASSSREIYSVGNWTFSNDSHSFKANVPGCIHLDLFNNGLIENPFYGLNEKVVSWVEEVDWTYTSSFAVDQSILDKDNIEIVFDGLDTYASVYLNSILILKADNMYMQWRASVKSCLLPKNLLIVKFLSPVKTAEAKMDKTYCGIATENRTKCQAYIRKAPYHFGSDWGPTLITTGIWREVKVEGYNSIRIDYTTVDTLSIDSQNNAQCVLTTEIFSSIPQHITLEFIGKKELDLLAGNNIISMNFAVNNALLWWCNTLGTPNLYHVALNIFKESTLIESKATTFGIRTLKLINRIVKPHEDESFYFELNGQNVYVRGANFIPSDSFVSRSESNNTYYLKKAVESNMNMIRVWGGGVYQSDAFYSKCDELGIMVWAEFMFAWAMYPANDEIAASIRQEAIYNVKRIRSHPSLALWAGNNEIWVGYNYWGWSENGKSYKSWKLFDQSVGNYMYNDYMSIFHNILPTVISEHDPQRAYWPSTPQSNYGNVSSLNVGDIHYWEVWGANNIIPINHYNMYVGRFVSEYGFQSYPSYYTLRSVIPEENMTPNDPFMLNHQKARNGNWKLAQYMNNELGIPSDFKEYIYWTQLMQAYAIETAVTAHRVNKNRTMGTMYWQINDCWPVISWASIDYYGREKAMQYSVKRMYSVVYMFAREEGSKLVFYLINDGLYDAMTHYNIESCDLRGKCIDYARGDISADHTKAVKVQEISSNAIAKSGKMNSVIRMSILGSGVMHIEHYFFHPMRLLELNDPKLIFNTSSNNTHMTFSMSTTMVAKNVFIECEENGDFSDNNFDMVNEKRVITLRCEHPLSNRCSYRTYLPHSSTTNWMMITILSIVGVFLILLIITIIFMFCK